MRRKTLILIVAILCAILLIGIVSVYVCSERETIPPVLPSVSPEADSVCVQVTIPSSDTITIVTEEQQTDKYVTPMVHELTDRHITAGAVYYEEENAADERFVGKWQNCDNPLWYKVYYDDYDADGYYWGKEWNEADNVYEPDLAFHGNGWFRWRVESSKLYEFHTQDINDIAIPKVYIFSIKNNHLEMTDRDFRTHNYSFIRCNTFQR